MLTASDVYLAFLLNTHPKQLASTIRHIGSYVEEIHLFLDKKVSVSRWLVRGHLATRSYRQGLHYVATVAALEKQDLSFLKSCDILFRILAPVVHSESIYREIAMGLNEKLLFIANRHFEEYIA